MDVRRTASIIAWLATAFVALPAGAQQIWLVPQASVPPATLARAVDYMDLFRPDAPWKQVAAHVAVFKLYPNFVGKAPQDQIDTIVSDLNRRHIAIALETGVMNVGPASTHPPCGGLGLVEGYGTTAQAENACRKIEIAGGRLTYLDMDEPLWYGHYFKGRKNGQPGCQSSIDDVLDLMKPTLDVYRQHFPNVLIGDVEPTVIAEQPDWQRDLLQFSNGYKDRMGEPLAWMQIDIPWARPDEESFAVDYYNDVQKLKAEGLIGEVGIIYDASAKMTTDDAWVADAEAHVHQLESVDGLHPDQVLIQSWMPNPTHVLPETASDTTLTGLALWYIDHNAPR